MDDFEQKSAELGLMLSEFAYKRLGRYKSGINFQAVLLKETASTGKKKRAGNTALIAFYILVVMGCVGAWVTLFVWTRNVESETAIIVSKINETDEKTVTDELAAFEARRAELDLSRGFYNEDADAYKRGFELSSDLMNRLNNVAYQWYTTIKSLDFNAANRTITITCETDAANVTFPFELTQRLREEFPDGRIGYSGYTAGKDAVAFEIVCTFPDMTPVVEEVEQP